MRDNGAMESPLLQRIRDAVIGDDQVMWGPFGAAPGHLRRLHRVRAGAGLHRGLHPRRGAAAVRQHAHRVLRHRAADDPAARGRPPDHQRRRRRRRRDRGHLHRLRAPPARSTSWSRILGLRVPAELDDRYACPRRSRPPTARSCSSGRSSTTPTSCRGASPSPTSSSSRRIATATSTCRACEAELVAARRPAAEDRLVLRGLQRHRDRQRHARDLRRCCTEHGALSFWDFAAAGAVRRHRHVRPVHRHPLAYKDAVFISPHKFVGGPGTPGRPGRAAGAAAQPRAHCARRRHGRLRQPDRPPLHRRRGAPRGGRHAGDRRVDPGRPGVPAQAGRRHRRRSARTRSASCARRSPSWKTNPNIEILGNLDADRLSIVSFVVRRPGGRYLHHNFVVALLNDLFGIQSRGGCSCAGPYGHRLLGIDIERSHRVRAGDHRRLRGHQAGLGAGQLQLLHLRGGASRTSSTPSHFVATHGWSLLPRVPLRPVHRPLAAPRRPGRAAAAAVRAALRRRRRAALAVPARAGAGVGAGRSTSTRRAAFVAAVEPHEQPDRRGLRQLRGPALVRSAGDIARWHNRAWHAVRGGVLPAAWTPKSTRSTRTAGSSPAWRRPCCPASPA